MEGYSPKDLQFDEEGRRRLAAGVSKMAKAVGSTLGPSGNTVLIESPMHTHGITVTKDGVTVAKAIDLIDPIENLAVKMMKEAADRTAVSAGDGTTTSVVLTSAMVLYGLDVITPAYNRTEVLRSMVDITEKVVDRLGKKSKKVTDRTLTEVATISANNDKSVGKIIADVYKEVGLNGVVTVERSQDNNTYAETTMGLKIDRGYSSNLFVNDQKKDECIFDDVMVLVADMEISNILQIENVLKPIISENKKLLVIAPCSNNVINTFAANVMKNGFKVCVIQPPSFGYKQHELMQDIAVSVGATYFSEKTGDDLSHITYADLGHAAKCIVSRDKTVLLKSDYKSDEAKVSERIEQLKDAHAMAKRKGDKDFIMERIASLKGGIGVIYVGGNTDLEQKELFDRVDDAVCAVRSALEEGILPGGGKALYEIYPYQLISSEASAEQVLAADILRHAFEKPLKTIFDNAGISMEFMYAKEEESEAGIPEGWGYNVKTMAYGPLIKMGVIDPAKVTRSALQNAVSVATTILSTNAIITMARSYGSN